MRVVPCREMAFGEGHEASRLEVMMNSAEPEAIFVRVCRRSALASGSSSSVVAV